MMLIKYALPVLVITVLARRSNSAAAITALVDTAISPAAPRTIASLRRPARALEESRDGCSVR